MTPFDEGQTARLLIALVLLLASAHLTGSLFAARRQPRVVGEIVGGVLLGPSLLGAIAPGVQDALFPPSGPVPAALGGLYQLGLVLLMFTTGLELRTVFEAGERRAAAGIAIAGVAFPFVVGLGAAAVFDLRGLEGPAHNGTALALVFAAAMAVTSIPVISRIMFDLGVLRTSFARIVIGAAIVDDLVLYAILAVAVGIAQSTTGSFGLAHELGIDSASAAGAAYYALATVALLVTALLLRRALERPRSALAARLRPLGESILAQLLFLLAVTAGCLLLNVTPVFGGLLAGLIVGALVPADTRPNPIATFSLMLFVPLYFALVGFRIDLGGGFDPLFFLAFVAAACVVKASSVYGGARGAGEPRVSARNLAVAMNARGGPGIVLASAAFDAKIIDSGFFAALVSTAIVTSMLAGWWLQRVLLRGEELRPGSAQPGPRHSARDEHTLASPDARRAGCARPPK